MEYNFKVIDVTKLPNGFIKKLYYRVTLLKDGKTVDTYDHLHFNLDNQNEPFTPFEQLTEEDVTAWIELELGEEKIEEIHEKLLQKHNKNFDNPEVTLNPWVLDQSELEEEVDLSELTPRERAMTRRNNRMSDRRRNPQ